MKIGIISSKRTLYSSKRLADEGRKRGHDVRLINPLQCVFTVEANAFNVTSTGLSLDTFDYIIPRIGTSLTDYGIALLIQFEALNIPALNSSQSIHLSKNKLLSLQHLARHNIAVPRTAMAATAATLTDAIDAIGGPPLIFKMLRGTQGVGVIKSDSYESALSTATTLWKLGETLLIQEYIAESRGTDLRAFVVGDKVVAAMIRKGPDDDFRSNLHLGGTSTKASITDEQRQIAIQACKTLGLNVAGVDILLSDRGPLIMEVNSSPGLEGIEKTTGRNVAREILKFIENNH